MAQSRPDYSGIFEDGWLRKQKRNELREFIRGDTVYAIVEGPPGSLKTACVRQVAEGLAYAVSECDVDGRYDDERSRAQALRSSTPIWLTSVREAAGVKWGTWCSMLTS